MSNEPLDHSLESLGQNAVDSDPPVPEFEKKLADVIADLRRGYHKERKDGHSFADAVSLVDEFNDVLYRSALKRFGGEEGAENYGQIMAAFDEGAQEIRGWLHRYIEEIYAGRSQVEIDNRKAIVDTLVATAMVLLPGGRMRRRGGGSRDGKPESEAPSGHDSLPHYIDPATGRKVFEVNVTKQRSSDAVRGTPEYDALNNPQPNATYKLSNGVTFETNAYRLVEYREFVPVDEKRGRSRKQAQMARKGRPTDQGGHFQAARSGGSADWSNLFPQDANFNNSEFKKWENHIRRNFVRIPIVRVRLIRNNPKEPRPDGVAVEWVEDGKERFACFENEPGG